MDKSTQGIVGFGSEQEREVKDALKTAGVETLASLAWIESKGQVSLDALREDAEHRIESFARDYTPSEQPVEA